MRWISSPRTHLRVVWRLIALALWLFLSVSIAALLHLFHGFAAKRWLVQQSFAMCCRIMGFKLHVNNAMSKMRPLLLVSNHLSYLDVFVLGSIAPVRFAPKSEIANWPVIGSICRIIGCVFITRRISAVKESCNALAEAFAMNDAVSLFPEGTTSDGKHMLPFKSSLFGIIDNSGNHPLTVQPALIHYTRINNLPIDSVQLPRIAWYGDMQLLPHLLDILRIARLDVEVTFFTPVVAKDRKELAKACQQALQAA